MKKKIPLCYTGAVLDTSGYAHACRDYINSLLNTDEVDLTVKVQTFEKEKTDHGDKFKRIEPLINKSLDHKIQIIHLTPENYPAFRRNDKYNIAYTVWETEELPAQWIHLCNIMDEIWVPSDWNIEVFKRCGVTKPIFKIPHVVECSDLSNASPLSIEASSDTYLFYSIFQWIERKNPVSLLKAYLTEFHPAEKVCLALKTYRINTHSSEQNAIKQDIINIKKSLNLKDYPPLLFFGNLLSSEQMKGLHARGDCYVLAHRGEGFGIPIAEAMGYGKPVIATGYSGNMEFMNTENSFPCRYTRTPVSGMIFPNYHGHMTWAEPDIMHIRQCLRFCFQHREEAKKKGELAKRFIQDQYNSKRIGELMVNRLRQISEGLK